MAASVATEIFSAAELAEINAYHAPVYLHAALDSVLWPLALVLMVRFVPRPLGRLADAQALRLDTRAPWLRTAPVVLVVARVGDRMWGGPGWGAALLFGFILFEGFTLIDLPVDIYFGFFREHEYGMSRETAGQFAWDWLKGNTLMAVAVAALAFGLFGLARRLTAWWWVMGLVASVAMTASSALDPYRARLYVDQTPLPQGELRDRIVALMEKAGIDFQDILVDKTSARTVRLQAYFAGSGPTRTINLNDSLLSALTTDEILAVVGHEAGHVGESRWPARVGSALALLLFLGLVELVFRTSAKRHWFGVDARADIRTLPLILLVFDLSMTAAGPVSAALSREREYEADRYAVALTHRPDAFRSMLVKAARLNKMDPSPPQWLVLKGLSHPPIGERIEAVR
jgi:STE24 endopeptidase